MLEQLRLGHILPAKVTEFTYELFHVNYLAEPFKRFPCLIHICSYFEVVSSTSQTQVIEPHPAPGK